MMATLFTVGIEVQASKALQAVQRMEKALGRLGAGSSELSKNTQSLGREYDKAAQQMAGMNREIDTSSRLARQAARSFGVMTVAMGNIASSAILGAFVSLNNQIRQLGANVIRTGAQAEKTAVAFETFLGSAKAARDVMRDVQKFAATTPFELPEVTEAAKQLLATRTSADQLIPTIKMLGEIAAGADKPLSQLLFVYTQIKNQGRALGQDINQLLNAGLSMEDIAKALGKSAKELGEMKGSSQGLQLSFAEVDKVLRSVTSEGGRFYGLMDKLGSTTAVKLSNLNDAFTKIYQSIYEGISPAISGVLDLIVSVLDPLGENKSLWIEINAQALEFQRYLEQNPAIARAVGDAIDQGLRAGLDAAAELAKGLLGYLKENPDAIAKAVNQVDLLVKGLGEAYKIIALAVEGWEKIAALAGAMSGGDRITPTSGAERIMQAGGTAADARGFQEEVARRIGELPFWDAFNNAKKEEIVKQVFQEVLGRVERQQRNIARAGESPSERAMRSGSYGSSGKALFPKSSVPATATEATGLSDEERKKLEQEALRQEKELADKRKQEFEERQRREREAFQDRKQYEETTLNQRTNYEMRIFDLQTRHQQILKDQRLETESEIARAVIRSQQEIESLQRQIERRRLERQLQMQQRAMQVMGISQQMVFEQGQARQAARFNQGQFISGGSGGGVGAIGGGGGMVFPVKRGNIGTSPGQRFDAPRDGGRRKHNGIDITAGQGEPVYAVIGGQIKEIRVLDASVGSHGIHIAGADGNTYAYNHVRPNAGLRVGANIATGAQFAQVSPDDRLSTGAHLDIKVKNSRGQFFDPTSMLSKLPRPGQGGASRVATASTGNLFNNPLATQIYETARKLGLDPSTAIAIAAKESGGGKPQNITHLNRKTGKVLQSPSTNAYGPFVGSMQVGWGAAVEAGYQKNDRYDPQKNIEIGIKYFQKLLRQFGGDTRKALAAYNAGPGNISAGLGYADSVLNIRKSIQGIAPGGGGAGGGMQPYGLANVPNVTVTQLDLQAKLNELHTEQSINLREQAIEQAELNKLIQEQANIAPQMMRENVRQLKEQTRQIEIESNLLRLQGEERKDYLAQLEYEKLYKNEILALEQAIRDTADPVQKLALQKALVEAVKQEGEVRAAIAVNQAAQDQLEAQRKQVEWADSQIQSLKTMSYSLAVMNQEQEMAVRMADNMGNAFADAFTRFVTGTGTAQEAFAGFMSGMVNVFAQEVQRMVAVAVANNLFPGLLNLFGGGTPNLFGGGFSGIASPGFSIGGGFGGGGGFSLGGITGGVASGVALPGFSVPALADGGVVRKPTMALIGERGPEAVVPLDQMGGVNSVVNVTVNNDGSVKTDSNQGNELGRAIQRAVVDEIARQKRSGGLLASVK
jgi:murein DD-endopeptidase MepM/ murein hydrolase activator NlpD